jgi:mersacidin/lichenicidin family type 2 lantibiotic
VIRAWKDAKYRRSLNADELASLPANPAGLVELSDDQLRSANGLFAGGTQTTALTCTEYSFHGWKQCGCGVPTTSITCTQYTFNTGCCP